MRGNQILTRRSVLLGPPAVALGRPAFAAARQQAATPGSAATPVADGAERAPLWRIAAERGLIFGSAMSTRLLEDADYSRLVDREAALLFTEDDLLWYKLRPTPDAPLDFTFGDQFIELAGAQRQLVFGAHLVWDEGFGEGWTEDDLWGMDERAATDLIYGTVEEEVRHYRGQVAGWIVVNEVVDAHESDGLRRDFLWYDLLGPSFIAESFRIAHAADPEATLVLNEFGHETDSEWDSAADRRAKTLLVLDQLLAEDVPVHAMGVQAHLTAGGFAEQFDPEGYRRFLSDLADRDVNILITELDVLDDGLEADPAGRDQAIADTYRRYLDVALDEPAVSSLMTFGLSDRHTWLQEDYPRENGAPRRPLPYDEELQAKPAYDALVSALEQAPERPLLWELPR